MKKSKLLLVFVGILALAGCELLIGTFTASINNVAWEASVFGAVKNGNQYTITATKNTASLVITLPGTAVGTYNINPLDTALDAVLYTPDYNNTSNYYLSTQGVVDLTKVSEGRLTGTFNVWAKNSVTATDSIPITGQFSNIISN
jgi:hypothetical protein